MKQVDDIFKKGLDMKGLPEAQEGWAGMEQLLRKKRAWYVRLWYMPVALLIIGALFRIISVDESSSSDTTVQPVDNQDAKALNAITISGGSAVSTANETSSEAIVTGNEYARTENSVVMASHQEESGESQMRRSVETSLGNTATASATGPVSSSQAVHAEMSSNAFNTIERSDVSDASNTLTPADQNIERSGISRIAAFEVIEAESITDINDWGKDKFIGCVLTGEPVELNPRQRAIPMTWRWGADFGLIQYRRDFGANPEPWRSEEAALLSSQFNIHTSYGTKHWRLQSGLGLMMLNERTNYVQNITNWRIDSTLRMIDPFYDTTSRGSRVALLAYQVDSLNLGDEQVVNSPNARVNFSYLTLPVSLQYEQSYGRFVAFGELGITYFRLISSSGIYRVPAGSREDEFTTALVSQIAKKDLLLVNGRVGVTYRLTNQVGLSLSYSRSGHSGSMITSHTQQPILNALRLGAEFRF